MVEFVNVIAARIEAAQQYLAALDQLAASCWVNSYEDYKRGRASLPAAMALLHPRWYDNDEAVKKTILGPRAFTREQGLAGVPCQAATIWGYECGREAGECAADHLFPYSAGGPTLGSNKLYLCALHNQLKGNDIHLFPWERVEPEWVAQKLQMINKLAF